MTGLFMNLLNWINSWVGNYGWSIVIFTLMIRFVLLPLDIKSKKSMRAMQRIQPKLQALQTKYANDKDKLSMKTMELYKKEGVSPMAGCLPMLIQLPVLFIMFGAMRTVGNERTIQMILDMKEGIMPTLESWLWIKNVFQPDSFGATILPAIGDQLMAIQESKHSLILTAENIAAAKEFLASAEYAAIAAEYGTGAFIKLPLNLLIVRPTLTFPTSIANLMAYANGLCILPILAGVSQFVMTATMNGTQKKASNGQPDAQQDAANAMNSPFMKWFFPIFSIWICLTSNAAFSIYWMAANVIQIIQQFAVNAYFKSLDAKEAAAANTDNK
ncbi:MAG: YidC/Oxa1 family membrane protein insertase [Clostridiales bacterium]|nr:YidC/Oxa1 family membrane protein insertase [Clostridiales bacterium]